jgi:hypothetical protein
MIAILALALLLSTQTEKPGYVHMVSRGHFEFFVSQPRHLSCDIKAGTGKLEGKFILDCQSEELKQEVTDK